MTCNNPAHNAIRKYHLSARIHTNIWEFLPGDACYTLDDEPVFIMAHPDVVEAEGD